nr:MAG TPA: major capsid protein [Caudoviricetes sp.]
MNSSLFLKYVLSFFPILKTLIEKINGKRKNELTYLHKDTSILRRVYSTDNKWEADTVDTSYVAADYVAIDSPVPLKARDRIAVANGKLPKMGMKKHLKESEILALRMMEVQGGQTAEIRRKLAQDPVSCSVGIDERNEYALLYGLSNGYVAVRDDDNPKELLRISYQYLEDNKLGINSTKEGLTVDDLKNAIDRAASDGNTIIQFWIAKTAFDALKKTQGAKELVATYNGQSYDSNTKLPTPTTSKFQEAFEDETGVTFRIINRTVRLEEDGVRRSVKPWNKNMVIGVCNTMIGALVYGQVAEATNRVNGVTYQQIDYKLISQYSTTDPLMETTAIQAYCLPVVEDVDTIYQIDLTVEDPTIEVNDEKEALDTSDEKVTIADKTYKKADAITGLNALGASLANNASDAEIIAAYNELPPVKKGQFKTNVTSEL